MQIIIVGCGKVGRKLAAQLSKENNNVTVVDMDPERVRNVSTMYDVMGVVGNGTSYTVLEEADIEHTDIMIAVTESDEVNLLCCVIGKRRGRCHTIARLRNPVYSQERYFLRSELQISMTINQDLEAAREIARLLRFPNAIEIESFAKDRIDLLRFKMPEGSSWFGRPLKDIARDIKENILVSMVDRGGEIIIPDGNTVIEEGDILTITAIPWDAEKFFKSIGVKTNRCNSVMIVGGGSMAYYLTQILKKDGLSVKIIERDRKRCEFLGECFPDVTVECGDGSDQKLLQEEYLENMDALVACTGIDEVNAILSKYAQSKVKKKVITKLNHIEFNEVIKSLELDSVVEPKALTTQRILQYVRAMGESMNSEVETLYRLMDDRVEALEFMIHPGSSIIGEKLVDMKIRKNTLIAGIMRAGNLIIPGGQDEFKEGDSVIVVTTNLGFDEITDILEP